MQMERDAERGTRHHQRRARNAPRWQHSARKTAGSKNTRAALPDPTAVVPHGTLLPPATHARKLHTAHCTRMSAHARTHARTAHTAPHPTPHTPLAARTSLKARMPCSSAALLGASSRPGSTSAKERRMPSMSTFTPASSFSRVPSCAQTAGGRVRGRAGAAEWGRVGAGARQGMEPVSFRQWSVVQ